MLSWMLNSQYVCYFVLLGNASLACKIKEISDLGRTGAFPTITRSASSSSEDDLTIDSANQTSSASSAAAAVVQGAPAIGTVSTLVAAFSQKPNARPPLVHQASEKKRKFESTLGTGPGARKASLMEGIVFAYISNLFSVYYAEAYLCLFVIAMELIY